MKNGPRAQSARAHDQHAAQHAPCSACAPRPAGARPPRASAGTRSPAGSAETAGAPARAWCACAGEAARCGSGVDERSLRRTTSASCACRGVARPRTPWQRSVLTTRSCASRRGSCSRAAAGGPSRARARRARAAARRGRTFRRPARRPTRPCGRVVRRGVLRAPCGVRLVSSMRVAAGGGVARIEDREMHPNCACAVL